MKGVVIIIKTYVNTSDIGVKYDFVPIKKINKVSYSFEIDRSLLHLKDSLEDLQRHCYPTEISNRLQNFINDIEKMIFPKCPKDMDLINSKMICFENYEEFIPNHKKENF